MLPHSCNICVGKKKASVCFMWNIKYSLFLVVSTGTSASNYDTFCFSYAFMWPLCHYIFWILASNITFQMFFTGFSQMDEIQNWKRHNLLHSCLQSLHVRDWPLSLPATGLAYTLHLVFEFCFLYFIHFLLESKHHCMKKCNHPNYISRKSY